jgi:hypothetical protein
MRLNGRLFIGITTFPATASLVSQWTSNAQIRDCLRSSMHIPLYCQHNTHLIGVDGAWLTSLWDLPGIQTTICCSPMNKRANVCPQPGQLPWQAGVWPVEAGQQEDFLFELGRQNMSSYLMFPEKHARSQAPMSLSEHIYKCVSVVYLGCAWAVFWVRRAQLNIQSFFGSITTF